MAEKEVPESELERWKELYRSIGGMEQAIEDTRNDINILFKKEEVCKKDVDDRLKTLEATKNQARGASWVLAAIAGVTGFVLSCIALLKEFFK